MCGCGGTSFAREYGGLLSNRSFGGTQVQRTFYAAGQTGQQLLLGAYSGLQRQVGMGTVKMYNRHEMLDIVNIDGKCRGIIARNLITGELERHAGHAVLLCTGGYGNVFYLSTNAMGSNVTAAWKAHRRGAFFGNPCFTQIHPTCIPVSGEHQSKLTLMSESLRNDGRIWVPKSRMTIVRAMKFRKRSVTITWNVAILRLVTLFRVTSRRVQRKSAVMRDMVWEAQSWPFILTSLLLLSVTDVRKPIRTTFIMLLTPILPPGVKRL